MVEPGAKLGEGVDRFRVGDAVVLDGEGLLSVPPTPKWKAEGRPG